MVYQSCDYLNGFDTSILNRYFAAVFPYQDLDDQYKYQFVGYTDYDKKVAPAGVQNSCWGFVKFDYDMPKKINNYEVYRTYKGNCDVLLSGQITLYNYKSKQLSYIDPFEVKAGDYIRLVQHPLGSGVPISRCSNDGFVAEEALCIALEDAKPGEFFDAIFIPPALPTVSVKTL